MEYKKKFGRFGENNLSAKEWAWEFLRRNPTYQKAYKRLHDLSPAKRKAIEEVREKGFSAAHRVKNFSFNWFNFDSLNEPSRQDTKMADWLIRMEKYLANSADPEVPTLSLKKQYHPSSFALADWIDPAITPLPKGEAIKLGVIAIDSLKWFSEKKVPNVRIDAKRKTIKPTYSGQ